MTTKVYLTGYSGSTPAAIKAIADNLGATVIDIRFRAQSRDLRWSKTALSQSLTSYVHVPALGNAEYKTNGMRIADYEAGKKVIAATQQPVILLCACKSPHGCHRTVVGNMLRADGYTVQELGGKPEKDATLTLWPMP